MSIKTTERYIQYILSEVLTVLEDGCDAKYTHIYTYQTLSSEHAHVQTSVCRIIAVILY